MKKYLVIGKPIKHSQSPLLHNFWLKKNNINAIYDKEEYEPSELETLISKIREEKINGINVTVPFKEKIIPFLDKLSPEAEITQSVNTIHFNRQSVVGYNTDIYGFETAIKDIKYDIENKKILILGAGGVVPSIIFALNKMKALKIMISNRTKNKAERLKKLSSNLKVIDWGEIPDFDMIINATSLGLNKEDKIIIDFSKIKKDKLFFDIIYNPSETNFLTEAKNNGNIVENGKKMFIYQALASFKIWHGVQPEINDDIIKLLD